jgi:hypothetical protein
MRVLPSSNTLTVSGPRVMVAVSTRIGCGHRPATMATSRPAPMAYGKSFRQARRFGRRWFEVADVVVERSSFITL